MVLRMAGGLWILVGMLIVTVSTYLYATAWFDRAREKRRSLRQTSPEVQLEAELQSWLTCLRVEYAHGDLTLPQLELEVERHLRLYNEASRPGDRKEAENIVRVVSCPHDEWEEVRTYLDTDVEFICVACGATMAAPVRSVDKPALDWAGISEMEWK